MPDLFIPSNLARAWYEPILEMVRDDGLIARRERPGIFDPLVASPEGRCAVCDEEDHCLSRWEDDGGSLGVAARGRPAPPPA